MKKIISIVGAIAMMASMAFTVCADEPVVTASFVYDEDASSDTTAIFNVDITSQEALNSILFKFQILDASGNVVTTDYVEKNTKIKWNINENIEEADGNTKLYDTTGGAITVGMSASEGTFTLVDDEPEVELKLTLLKAITENLTFKFDTASTAAQYVTTTAGETPLTYKIGSGFAVSATLPTFTSAGGSVNATQSGSTFTDAADAKAVAYVATVGSDASGKTGRWYATINGTPMKTVDTFKLPNFSAENVKLGLVYKGAQTISNVAFKWE